MNTPHTHTADCTCHRASHTWIKIFLLLALLSAIVAGVARAQDNSQPPPQQRPQGRVVRLRYVEGDVQVIAGDATEFSNAVPNMPLQQDNAVQTGANGKAEIQFEDGSIARLTPGSQLVLTELGGTELGNLHTTIELRAGTGYFEVEPTGDDVFQVRAGGLQLSVPNKGSFRVDVNGTTAQVAVADGSISAQDNATNQPVNAAANSTLIETDSGLSVQGGTTTEPFDQWNEDRDNQLAQEAANTTQSQQGGDASGWTDLDYYGNWYPVPGTGPIWQPYGYGDDFDPFAGGYWADYSWGPAWISAYPWGWTPFHCGYWGWYQGFGWGWAPGGCGVGIWYPYPPVYHPPIGWRFPSRPRPGPGGHGRLFPMGKTAQGVRVLPAHPAPHNVNAPPVTIAGHQVRPVLAIPRPATPGVRSNVVGVTGPARAAGMAPINKQPQSGSPWRGGAPMPARQQQHFSAPPRSSPPPPSHSSSGGSSSHK